VAVANAQDAKLIGASWVETEPSCSRRASITTQASCSPRAVEETAEDRRGGAVDEDVEQRGIARHVTAALHEAPLPDPKIQIGGPS
jgi:hypothetical protein